jgi:hypothetical protein
MEITDALDSDVEAIVALWERCELTRPWNDPRADIALAQRTPTSTVLVGKVGAQIVATAMVGCEGHRGWVYYVAVEPSLRTEGHGRRIMDAAEARVRAFGAPKIQLMVRTDNSAASAFYRSIGYLKEETAVWGKRLDGKTWTVAAD